MAAAAEEISANATEGATFVAGAFFWLDDIVQLSSPPALARNMLNTVHIAASRRDVARC